MSRYSLAGDSELEREFELESIEADEEEDMTELEEEFEQGAVDEPSFEAREDGDLALERDDYVERFLELASREFESESEVDAAVNRVLHDMEREYFFKNLVKKVGSVGRKFLAQGVQKVGAAVGKNFPAVGALTQLARGNLKGMLAPLAKTALTAAFPGAAAALPALQALGFNFETDEDARLQREPWQNFVQLSREAYEELASHLGPEAQDPLGASKLAQTAFRTALHSVGAAGQGALDGLSQAVGQRRGTGQGRVRRIRVRRGERLLIEVL